jgi:maltokinase
LQQWREIHDDRFVPAYRKIPGRVLAGERWFAERETDGELVLKTTVQFQAVRQESRFLTLNLYELNGESDFLYYLPLMITTELLPERIAYFQRGVFYFYDGIPTIAYLELLTELFTRQQSVTATLDSYEFQFQITPGLMTPRFELNNSSSNSLVFVSQQYLVKNYRRIYPGINPELKLGLSLTEAGVECVPQILGSISCRRDYTEYTLGILQELVDHQGTGWAVWGSLLANHTAAEREELTRQALNLGRILAELHWEMARIAEHNKRSVAFDEAALRERIRKLAATAEAELTAVDPDLVARIRAKITQISTGMLSAAGLGRLFRIHGDLHLEQVLKTATGWKVIDFEGEPLKTIVQREYYDSPLKDLASLLRSVGYRVNTVTTGTGDCEAWLQMALVNGYRTRYREYQGDFLPANCNFDRLLNLFQLERVIYELSYEAKYRPDWLRIPLAGLAKLMEDHTGDEQRTTNDE